jgi:exopolysaccharide biosynthesis polyprenyl glycosylphosphotransferase
MRSRDTFDALCSLAAVFGDALTIYAGIGLATWIRFKSGWIDMRHDAFPPADLYIFGAGVATLLFIFIFQSLGLYKRPQMGTFVDKIPRLVRATGWSILLAITLAYIVQTDPPFSRMTVALSFVTVTLLLIIQRAAFFRIEQIFIPRYKPVANALIIGTDKMALRLKNALESEPHLRTRILGFLTTPHETEHDNRIPNDAIIGTFDDLPALISREQVHIVLLADSLLPRNQLVSLMIECERRLINFYLVPDIFRVLTSGVEVETIDGIPVIGTSQWPLDRFWNRLLKRTEDVIGAIVGLLLSAPVIAVVALLIKRSSPGPVFYRQVRCGEHGHPFTLYKLRTMAHDAEKDTGPVMTTPDDLRRTPIGAFLRRHNLDELPQFWNVLRGDMGLVGPRPERPHFVEQFKEDISRYMWRHRSKPGMTGWAQVNGLRGQSSLKDRIKYDLYYLENWSLALDFKIIIHTFLTRENAY